MLLQWQLAGVGLPGMCLKIGWPNIWWIMEIFSFARLGGPSTVESICLWDPRLESTFSLSTTFPSEAGLFSDSLRSWLITLGLFLGGLVGLPCSFFFSFENNAGFLVWLLENDAGFLVQLPQLVCRQNSAIFFLWDAAWRSQISSRWNLFPPPSCGYLKYNLPHPSIPKDTWWSCGGMLEQSWWLCQCHHFYNRQLGQQREWLIASGMGYQ